MMEEEEVLVDALKAREGLQDILVELEGIRRKLTTVIHLIPNCSQQNVTVALHRLLQETKTVLSDLNNSQIALSKSPLEPDHSQKVSRMNLDYTILADPWWIATYATIPTPHQVVGDIIRFRDAIVLCRKKKELAQYMQGYETFHRLSYLRELLVGEGIIQEGQGVDPPIDPLVYVEKLLSGEIAEANPAKARLTRKVQNMNRVIQTNFPTIFWPSFDLSKLTPQWICSVHAAAMEGLLDNCGQYRTRYASPTGEAHTYLAPHLIRPSLDVLCKDVRHEIALAEGQGQGLLERIKIVAAFLSVFLQIHPFSNGNGRVVRVLTSLLLAETSVVPVALCGSGQNGRNDYLRCLRESQSQVPFVPVALSRLILDSVLEAHRTVCLALDLH